MKMKTYFLLCLIFIALNTQLVLVRCVDEGFFNSARLGDTAALKDYLNKGIPIDSRDSKGNSPIIIASGRGHIQVMLMLLENGANVEDCTQSGLFEGKSALGWASSQGRTQAVATLLKAGADPNKSPTHGIFAGKTPLMWASSQGRTQVVRLLLSANVDVNYSSKIGNFKGKSSLMWASSQGRVDTVITLLQAGAAVNAKDNDGVNALMWASGSEAAEEAHKKGLQFLEKATKGQKEVVRALLEYGAVADDQDKDGISAIMYACYHGLTGAVEVLLNWGADGGPRNLQGHTALQLALNAGFEDTANLILHGPTIMNLSVPEMVRVSVCGWLLSVLRYPRGTGIFTDSSTSTDSDSDRSVSGSSNLECSLVPTGTGTGTTPTKAGANTDSTRSSGDSSSSAAADTKTKPTSSPKINTNLSNTQKYQPLHSINKSCSQLKIHGLEYYALSDVLELVTEVGVEEVVKHLGLKTFASITRAKLQLKELHLKYKTFKLQNSPI